MNDDFESLVKKVLNTNIEATKNYVKNLDSSGVEYLYTKPFRNNLHGKDFAAWCNDIELSLNHLSIFVNIAHVIHSLSPDNIIEIGCGPGWLSEYLARLGFDVTGIDISEDFIEIAEKRKRHIPYFEKLKLRYIVADAHYMTNKEKYDCVVLYSTLHHLDDPEMTLKNIYNLLTEKGFLIIYEGQRPPKGSSRERKLIDEMMKSGWLERPFFKEELIKMLRSAGFENIEKLISPQVVFGLQSKSEIFSKSIIQRLSREDPTNFFIAFKNIPDLTFFNMNPNHLSASITPISLPELNKNIFNEKILSFRFRVNNKGRDSWSYRPSLLVGYVTFAALVSESGGRTVIDKRVPLNRIVKPGEYIDVDITIDIANLKTGRYKLIFDLVCEHVAWFSKFGTKPYELVFDVI